MGGAALVAVAGVSSTCPSSAADDDRGVPFLSPGVGGPQRVEGLELGVAGRLLIVF